MEEINIDPCVSLHQVSTPQWVNNYGFNENATIPTSVGSVTFCGCGLSQSTGSIRDPAGNPIKVELASSQTFPGCSEMSFQIVSGMLLGKYDVLLQDNAVKLVDTFTLSMPAKPDGFWTGSGGWFFAFKPDEKLHIIFYKYVDNNYVTAVS